MTACGETSLAHRKEKIRLMKAGMVTKYGAWRATCMALSERKTLAHFRASIASPSGGISEICEETKSTWRVCASRKTARSGVKARKRGEDELVNAAGEMYQSVAEGGIR
jgi:hypothetical protein